MRTVNGISASKASALAGSLAFAAATPRLSKSGGGAVTLIRRLAFSALFVIASATPLAAQYWAKPAKTPNTDVTCTNCSGKAKGLLTPGYPSTLGTYVGRYLDSDASNDCQQPVRTMRAVDVIPKPSLNAPHGRIYMQVGS